MVLNKRKGGDFMKTNPYKKRARDLENTLREVRDDLDEALEDLEDDEEEE